MNSALKFWREKRDYLLTQEAIEAGANQKFELRKLIEEAEAKIKELDIPPPGPIPPVGRYAKGILLGVTALIIGVLIIAGAWASKRQKQMLRALMQPHVITGVEGKNHWESDAGDVQTIVKLAAAEINRRSPKAAEERIYELRYQPYRSDEEAVTNNYIFRVLDDSGIQTIARRQLPPSLSINPSTNFLTISYWQVDFRTGTKSHFRLEDAQALFREFGSPTYLELEEPGYDLAIVKLVPNEPSTNRIALGKRDIVVAVNGPPELEKSVSRTIAAFSQLPGFEGASKDRILDFERVTTNAVDLTDPLALQKKLLLLRKFRVDYILTLSIDSD